MVTPPALHAALHPLLQVAADLHQQRLTAAALPEAVSRLPALNLNQALLDELAQQAAVAALNQPAYAYALMTVADAAAQHSGDLFLRALAAWYLARAANGWVQPRLVETAVARAHTLFTQLDEPGWRAACAWQRNALPWTRPDFTAAAVALEQALADLLAAGFDDFAPHCRLSLAYAYLLIGRFDDAERETAVAQQTFQQIADDLGLAHCHYTQASILRRQTHFAPAIAHYEEALALYEQAGAAVQIASVNLQLGMISWWWQQDLHTATTRLAAAAAAFAHQDIPLWQAQCDVSLAQIYQQTGQLTAAATAFATARNIFAQFQARGPWADALLESGWLELYRGQYAHSLAYFQQAEILYDEIGNRWLPAITQMHQGEVHVQMGHYQRALHCLETAHHRLTQLDMPQRLAACEVRLARVCLQLNQWPQARSYLDQAGQHYQESGQAEGDPALYKLRAELLWRTGAGQAAIPVLDKALAVARQQGDQPQTARIQRLLGQTLTAGQQFTAAQRHLQTAVAAFREMGMLMDQVAGQVNLGRCYCQAHDHAAARAAWEEALSLAPGVAPDLEWQAYAGLAELDAAVGDGGAALSRYRQAIDTLGKLRRALWQPAVVGAYLARPLPMLDQAVTLAAAQGATADMLHFIEESKAQTTARQLRAPSPLPATDELAELAAEIRWLQQQLRATTPSATFSFFPNQDLHQQFVQKVQQYDTAVSQLERATWVQNPLEAPAVTFNLDQFRQYANAHLGDNWLALDYYQSENQIQAVTVTPDEIYAWRSPITPATRLAIKLCGRAPRGQSARPRDLAAVGGALLPERVRAQLEPSTHLLIAPSRQLHRLPWAGLLLGTDRLPLAAACIPVITPSLQSLVQLWQRPQAAYGDHNSGGLFITVGDFQGRHPALPAVAQEADALSHLFASGAHRLTGAEATFANWRQLSQTMASNFSFLHIATHAFSDQFSGRLTGLALADQDLWLDELAQLAPLPPLVTLSACSGLRNALYEGDEAMGIPIACLAAGAQRVVGSLWPILDQETPDFMLAFYRHLLSGARSAEALTLTQRTAANAGLDVAHWGSFLCVGQP